MEREEEKGGSTLSSRDKGKAPALRQVSDVADYGNINVPADGLGMAIESIHYSYNRTERGNVNTVEGGVKKVMKSGDVD